LGINDGAITEEEEGNREVGGWARKAVDAKLEEPPGEAEPARSGLVADSQFPTFSAKLLGELFNRVEIVGNRAVMADFAAAAWLGQSDRDAYVVDIQTDKENRFSPAPVFV
jgi:hypothetical protein